MNPPVGSPLARRHALCIIHLAYAHSLSFVEAAQIVERLSLWLDRNATSDLDVDRLLGGAS